jgi:hypothetical protein
MRSVHYAAALIIISLFFPGCARVKGEATGGQAPDYLNGMLRADFDRTVLGTYEATVKAMTDLGMTIRASEKNQAGGFIEATRPDDMKRVAVTFKAVGPNRTTAIIRVGAGGDEPYSRVVAQRIKARLKG